MIQNNNLIAFLEHSPPKIATIVYNFTNSSFTIVNKSIKLHKYKQNNSLKISLKMHLLYQYLPNTWKIFLKNRYYFLLSFNFKNCLKLYI